MKQISCMVNTPILSRYGFAHLALKVVIDRINSVMTGLNYNDNLRHYIYSEVIVPDQVANNGLELDYIRELESELRIVIGELEFDNVYSGTLLALSQYAGRPYSISYASPAGCLVLISIDG